MADYSLLFITFKGPSPFILVFCPHCLWSHSEDSVVATKCAKFNH